MKEIVLFAVVMVIALSAGAIEKEYQFHSMADVMVSKYSTSFQTAVSSERDEKQGGDVAKITYAVKPGTKKTVSLDLNFPALSEDGWKSISKVSFKLRGGLGHISVLLHDRDGETFAPKGIRPVGGSAWRTYDFHFGDLASKNYSSWGGKNKRNGKADAPVSLSLRIVVYPSYIASQLRGMQILNSTKPTEEELTQGMKPVDFYIAGLTITGSLSGEEKTDSSKNSILPAKVEFTEIGTAVPLKPGHGEVLKYTLSNPTGKAMKYHLDAISSLALSDRQEKYSQEIELKTGEIRTFELPFKFQEKGVHNVRLRLVSGGMAMEAGTFVNVWTPVGNQWKDTPDTFFGTQAALDLFGRHFGKYREQDYKNMRDAGVKLIRFTMRWSAIQPKKDDPLKWEPYDHIMKKCKEYGIIPYPMISNAPRWTAADKKEAANAPKFVYACVPDNDLYAEFVGKVAERYKDYTNYLQIWNEPYAQQYYWGGSPESYTDMLRKAYVAAKAKNPEAKISAGSAWKEVFSSARGSYDLWPFHCHSDVEQLHESITHYRKTAKQANVPMSIFWCDETGFAVNPAEEGAEIRKAEEIIKKGVVCRAAGLGTHVWFVYRGSPNSPLAPRDNYPAIDEKNRCRPVVLAHNTMAAHLKQTRFEKEFRIPGMAEGYVFSRPGERVVVLWRSAFPKGQIATINFDKPVRGVFTNLLGTESSMDIPSGRISLPMSSQPQWLVIPDGVQVASIQYRSILEMPDQLVFQAGEKKQTIRFKVTNPLPESFDGTFEFLGAGGWKPESRFLQVRVPAGGKKEETMTFYAGKAVPPLAYPSFRLTEKKHNILISSTIKFVNCALLGRAEALLADIGKEKNMVLLRKGDVDPDMFWQGPQDLSARIYGSWNDEYLKLKVIVRDNRHFQTQEKGGLFDGDSVQVEVRTGRDRYQIGLAKTNNGALTFHQWRGKSEKTVEYNVERDGDHTIYTVAIPWKNLEITAKPGSKFMLSVLVNDNDGRCRKVLLEWGGGIHGMISHPMNPMILY